MKIKLLALCLLMVTGNSQSNPKVVSKQTPFREEKPNLLKLPQKNTQTSQLSSKQIRSKKTQTTQAPSNKPQVRQISNQSSQNRPKSNIFKTSGNQTKKTSSRFQLNQAPSISRKKQSPKQSQYGQSQFNKFQIAKSIQSSDLIFQIPTAQYRTNSDQTKPNLNQPQTKFSQANSPQIRISQSQSQNKQHQSNNIFSPKQNQSKSSLVLRNQSIQQKVSQSQTRQTLNQPQTLIFPKSQSQNFNNLQAKQVSSKSQSIYPQTNNFQQQQIASKPIFSPINYWIPNYKPIPNFDHQFRMTPIFNNSLRQNRYFQFFSKAFEIGAAYFRKVITVSILNQQQTIYKGTRCGYYFTQGLPEIYKTQGFDQNTTDMIVVLTDQLEITPPSTAPDPNTRAQANFCDMNRRITYARLNYNSNLQISNSTMVFYQWVQITIHEMFHFLGFNQDIFSIPSKNFWFCERDNIQKCYITTPRVKQYVQSHFNCYGNLRGALLSNYPYDRSHWNSAVYRNEIMTPIYKLGNKISRLSLLFLADTGFYSYVNTSFSEVASWGRAKGCEFAKGNVPMNHCEIGCDFYSRYVKNCSELNAILECQNPGVQSTSDNPNYFGPHSRCFNGMRVKPPENIFPSCLKAECDSLFIIRISVNGTGGICDYRNIGQDVTINNLTIRCPSDYFAFCSSKSCENWCNKRGVCLNGECLYLK